MAQAHPADVSGCQGYDFTILLNDRLRPYRGCGLF